MQRPFEHYRAVPTGTPLTDLAIAGRWQDLSFLANCAESGNTARSISAAVTIHRESGRHVMSRINYLRLESGPRRLPLAHV